MFSIDDTYADYPESVSIGGTVAALTNQAAPFPSGIAWSTDLTSIWGIAETSTSLSPDPNASSTYPATKYTGQANCNGNTSGQCDEDNIYTYYENDAAGAPIPTTNYAAGLCKATIDAYSDWYLPSVCQMGYDASSQGTGCGTKNTPTMQNMQSNLVDSSISGAPSGYYWGSTENSLNPRDTSWSQYFQTNASSQRAYQKGLLFGVRCVRALTSD